LSERLRVDGVGEVELTWTERGNGPSFLVLHGGAGPFSVTPWAELLARTGPARVLVPTHPGFSATPRPDPLHDVAGLARLYAALLDHLDLDHVTVVGNSVGGRIGAEQALLGGKRLRGLVIVDGVGIEVPGHPVADVGSLSLEEIGRMSYHDPVRYRIDPSKLPPAQQAMMAGNFATLKRYASPMTDPTLGPRLARLVLPTLVAWGESDRIVDPEYGRAFARAIPGAEFRLLTGAGHLPQIETPEELARVVWAFTQAQRPTG
jgi:pimeloyl-ACP methyl ester carboxylesterase